MGDPADRVRVGLRRVRDLAMSISLSYDERLRLMTFRGPGGFTQIFMTKLSADDIARVLGVHLEVHEAEEALS